MQSASQIIGRISVVDHEQVACAAWARAVGKKIAQHTRAAKLVRGRLVVEVEDATWQRNLATLSRHITNNLVKAIGPDIVSDIEFRILPPRREPQRAAVISAAGDESDAIEDPGMRRVYRAARHKERA